MELQAFDAHANIVSFGLGFVDNKNQICPRQDLTGSFGPIKAVNFLPVFFMHPCAETLQAVNFVLKSSF